VAQQTVPFLTAAALVFAIVWFYSRVIHVNLQTVGFTFLLAVLIVSATWGLRAAVFLAVLATCAYNYFFLPPLYQFTIADSQNWVALFAFLVTAVVASNLSERARSEALQSHERRREVERLYDFSQQLLLTENVFELLNSVPTYLVDSFGATGAVVYLEDKQKTYYSDVSVQQLVSTEELKAISSRGEPVLDRGQQICFMPLRLGLRSIGSLAITGCELSRATLEAIGSLVGIAIERVNTMQKLTKAEASREGDRLRSLLLDSVTHEFRTPLTSIKASAETLLSEVELDRSQLKELATIINEESDRLNRLVGEASEVAQLEAHQVELRFEPHQMREAVDAALQQTRHALEQHHVEVDIPEGLPPARMDLARITEVLVQLLENAGKYSPPGTPIHITVELSKSQLVTSVADHGPGIDDFDQAMIFEKFYRGRAQRLSVQGTGMGLAIAKAIVEMHNGTIGLTSQVGRGSVFHFSLPLWS